MTRFLCDDVVRTLPGSAAGFQQLGMASREIFAVSEKGDVA
jgi:hypothetical protein